MKSATGIHLGRSTLRLASFQLQGQEMCLCALAKIRFPLPLTPHTLRDETQHALLAETLQTALQGLGVNPGAVAASVGGGLYHIQKVPLEVASREDRAHQIAWEVSQALIAPPEAYRLDIHPAGRSAIWLAVRQKVLEAYAMLFESSGLHPEAFEAEPLALFYACQMAGAWTPGRNAALLHDEIWPSFIAAEDGRLVSAETVRVEPQPEGSSNNDPGPGGPTSPGKEYAEVARRWVFGDRVSDRRRAGLDRLLLCGSPEQVHLLQQNLQTPSSPELVALQPLSACNTDLLPSSQAHLLKEQSAFAVACGLAYRILTKDPA